MNIYVGNLAYEVTEEDLQNAFSGFGEVVSAKVITDQYSGRSKGFGFVEMTNNSEAEEAIKNLDGSELKGRKVKVNQAKPKSGGGGFRGGRGGGRGRSGGGRQSNFNRDRY